MLGARSATTCLSTSQLQRMLLIKLTHRLKLCSKEIKKCLKNIKKYPKNIKRYHKNIKKYHKHIKKYPKIELVYQLLSSVLCRYGRSWWTRRSGKNGDKALVSNTPVSNTTVPWSYVVSGLAEIRPASTPAGCCGLSLLNYSCHLAISPCCSVAILPSCYLAILPSHSNKFSLRLIMVTMPHLCTNVDCPMQLFSPKNIFALTCAIQI